MVFFGAIIGNNCAIIPGFRAIRLENGAIITLY